MKESDLDSALAALERQRAARCAAAQTDQDGQRSARSNQRATLGLVLVGLIVAAGLDLVTSTSSLREAVGGESRASKVFSNAESGTCLTWPPDEPDKPSFVQCTSDHMFEVAKSVVMDNFTEPCQLAVREYLGPRYDPNSRFTIGVLWAGDANGKTATDRLLCGLQLIGMGGKPTPFTGAIAELDQSRVWPPGTCLGVDTAAPRPTDIPVDCSAPHAAEITGSVGLAERFGDVPPTEADQDAFVRAECTRLSDEYLAPAGLAGTGLALEFSPVARSSWTAGSRQVACSVTPPAGPDWTPLVGSARPQRSDVQVPAAPPPPLESTTSETPPPDTSTSTTSPPTSVEPPPTSTATPTTTPTTPTAPESPAVGPPPGPPPADVPTETTPAPNVLLIPGLAPITLPFPAPAPPPPPAAPPPPPPAVAPPPPAAPPGVPA